MALPWITTSAPPRSFRSLFKWGAPLEFKHPNPKLYALLKEVFSLSDDDFLTAHQQNSEQGFLGMEDVAAEQVATLDPKHVTALTQICGAENADTNLYARMKTAYGKSTLDAMNLRRKKIQHIPDLVLFPRDKGEVQKIVAYCHEHKIPIIPYGGGTSVTQGLEAPQQGVALDFKKHMNKIIRLNPINQTVTVQPGMLGPDLERQLNQAPQLFDADEAYTCGHFPQSFEFSTVGGWVVTKGAGQNSTYYGKVEDMVICQEYVTPVGEIKTHEFARSSTGPDIDGLLMGAEGTFGILVSVTLKIYKHLPQNTRQFSFIFHDWEQANAAVREVMQGEFGFPSVFRLSDPEETDVAFRLYGIEDTLLDKFLKMRGYLPHKRCLLLGTADGDREAAKLIQSKIKTICKKHGAISASTYPVKKWQVGRFKDPYMREDLMDFGFVIDTLECAVNWENLSAVHQQAREYCKSFSPILCLSHMSHFYPQGTNLYFVFIKNFASFEEYKKFHTGFLETIYQAGAGLSHHHGIGRMLAPWLFKYHGPQVEKLLKVVKGTLDPHSILNPGGTLDL